MNLCYFHREILVQNYDPCHEIFKQILRQELTPENWVTPNLMFYHQFPYQNGHMLISLHEAIWSDNFPAPGAMQIGGRPNSDSTTGPEMPTVPRKEHRPPSCKSYGTGTIDMISLYIINNIYIYIYICTIHWVVSSLDSEGTSINLWCFNLLNIAKVARDDKFHVIIHVWLGNHGCNGLQVFFPARPCFVFFLMPEGHSVIPLITIVWTM